MQNELEIIVSRAPFTDCTISRIRTNTGLHLVGLELPWRGNKPKVSCIPLGVYDAFVRQSPTNGMVIELKDVPDRTFIQFHIGNYTSDIEGCILPGKSITDMNGDGILDVGNSTAAMRELLAHAKDKDKITVRITEAARPFGVYAGD